MRVNVQHTIGDLASDLARLPAKGVRKFSGTVKRNGREGTELARRFAQELSGPHGTNYFKRITGEPVGALEYEYGPHAGGVPVGGGWRHGAPNTELERSLDVIGPKLAADLGDDLEGLFW